MTNPKIIAYYLPQFHPTPNNNEWWGKGFTEWTNVAKAKPLFRNHYQPRIPSDLGFYDLRVPEVRELQAELAKEAGIYGFCYYHYWFGDGHQELDLPFNQIMKLKKPNFPFCLCWANESWHAKFWDKDGKGISKKILAEQKYLGTEDNEKHFYSILNAFKDERYIRYAGKPIFVIYQPLQFPNITEFIEQWNSLAKRNGLDGIYFIGQISDKENIYKVKELGFDGVNLNRLHDIKKASTSLLNRIRFSLNYRIFHMPSVYKYSEAIKVFKGEEDRRNDVYPTLIPNWDHSPRSGKRAYILRDSTPELFKKHASDVLQEISDKKEENQIVFLKSWNEWGEGNYMEPDMRFGKGYINVLKETIEKFRESS